MVGSTRWQRRKRLIQSFRAEVKRPVQQEATLDLPRAIPRTTLLSLRPDLARQPARPKRRRRRLSAGLRTTAAPPAATALHLEAVCPRRTDALTDGVAPKEDSNDPLLAQMSMPGRSQVGPEQGVVLAVLEAAELQKVRCLIAEEATGIEALRRKLQQFLDQLVAGCSSPRLEHLPEPPVSSSLNPFAQEFIPTRCRTVEKGDVAFGEVEKGARRDRDLPNQSHGPLAARQEKCTDSSADGRMASSGDKEKNMYLAKLAGNAERYDEMAEYLVRAAEMRGSSSVTPSVAPGGTGEERKEDADGKDEKKDVEEDPPTPGPADFSRGREHVQLKVQDQQGNAVFFKIRRTAPLRMLMDAYDSHLGMQTTRMRFMVNGQRIAPEDTVEHLGLKEEDRIDVEMEGQECPVVGAEEIAQGATKEMDRDQSGGEKVCSWCLLRLDFGDFAHGEDTCFGCREDAAAYEQALQERLALEREQERQAVQRVLEDNSGRVPTELRDATLRELSAADREALAAEAVEDWGADFVVYRAASGARYRVELRRPGRQVNLETATVRGIYRQPAPPLPGMLPWEAMVTPGATWQYEAAFRDDEVRKFRSQKELTDARVQVPYPEGVSRALETLHRAQLRAEFPGSG